MTTLLELTQKVLSDVGGDEVNSIFDTSESEITANIIVNCFDYIVANNDYPKFTKMVELENVADSDYPSHIKVPSEVSEILSLSYNKAASGSSRKEFRPVQYKEPDEFLRMTNLRDNTKSTVQEVTDFSGSSVFIINDQAPNWYTSLDDTYILFDSWDSAVSTTVMNNLIQARCRYIPSSEVTDEWEIPLPTEALPHLLAESLLAWTAKRHAQIDQHAQKVSLHSGNYLSRRNWTINDKLKWPDYGRRGKGGGYARRDPTFNRSR